MKKILENKLYCGIIIVVGFLLVILSYTSVVAKYKPKIKDVQTVISERTSRLNDLEKINSKKTVLR